MFALTFLGTSASVPSAERNHPALLVEAAGKRILIDCGEGTQRQLLRSGAGFRRLDRILLTHGHLDHVLGIPGLFSTLRLRQSADVMTIHGGAGTLDIVVQMLAGLWGAGRAPIPLEFAGLAEGRVVDGGEFTIDCFPVRHRDTDSFGFSFELRLAVTFGPIFSRRLVSRTVRCAENWPKGGRSSFKAAKRSIRRMFSAAKRRQETRGDRRH